MKITMVVDYDDTLVSDNFLVDHTLEVEGVEGVEVGDRS